MKIFTIGFTKKSAETFCGRLKRSGAKRLVDVRLNNVSQLAGFAKRDDLRYFTTALCNMEYVHLPLLAPTQDVLDAYKKHKGDWDIGRDRSPQGGETWSWRECLSGPFSLHPSPCRKARAALER